MPVRSHLFWERCKVCVQVLSFLCSWHPVAPCVEETVTSPLNCLAPVLKAGGPYPLGLASGPVPGSTDLAWLPLPVPRDCCSFIAAPETG